MFHSMILKYMDVLCFLPFQIIVAENFIDLILYLHNIDGPIWLVQQPSKKSCQTTTLKNAEFDLLYKETITETLITI